MGTRTKRTGIPEGSLLAGYLPADHVDSYSIEISGGRTVMPDEFFDTAFNRTPKWVDRLMQLRNALVKPLGLETDGSFKNEISGRGPNEVVFGMPDKHLTFHASLLCGEPHDGKQVLTITTIVKYNNMLGRIYFFFIRPFHGLIMRSTLRRVKKGAAESR